MKILQATLFILFFTAIFVTYSHADELKKKLIMEGEIGPGFMGSESFFLNNNLVKPVWTLIPTGILHLRFGDGEMLRPEILIEESGAFLFDRNGIREGGKPQSYGNYYLKLPLGIPFPFFSYKSSIAVDANYSVLNTLLKTRGQVVVNNVIRGAGQTFNAVSTAFTVRLYVNTPIVLNPGFFEHSYFGVYYSEHTGPRTASPGSQSSIPIPVLVDANSRSGGIFFEMKKDTLLKGLNIEISAYVGYADIEVRDDASVVNAKYGNLGGLVELRGRFGVNYRYVFDYGLGLKFSAGAEYYTNLEFFNATDINKYSLNFGGDLRYFANLTFIFEL